MSTENREGDLSGQPERRQQELFTPGLSMIRERLRRNSGIVVVADTTHDWPFGNYNDPQEKTKEFKLNYTKIKVAPTFPIRDPKILNAFVDRMFPDIDQDKLHKLKAKSTPWYDDRYALSIPEIHFSEVLGIQREEKITRRTGIIFDRQAYHRHREPFRTEEIQDDIEEKKYLRVVEINIYPDKRIAELSARFAPLKTPHVHDFVPGSQNDLQQLDSNLFTSYMTPQLYKRWVDGEDLQNVYFTQDGKFKPFFYRIPKDKQKEAREANSYKPSHKYFTEAFEITGGTEEGARVMLGRIERGLTEGKLAESLRKRGINISARDIRSIEKGSVIPSYEIYTEILREVTLGSREELESLHIFPEGSSKNKN
jgi:hypothetical protein